MAHPFFAVLRREYYLCIRRPNDWVSAIFFFFIVCSLFPIAVGTDQALLYRMAPGFFWIALLLATMLSITRIFEEDAQSGALEQVLFAHIALPLWVFAKVMAHAFVLSALFLLVLPLFALFFNVSFPVALVLALTVILGVPTLCLIGAMGAALVLGLRIGGLVLSLVVLPFFVPVLVFGVGAAQAIQMGLSAQDHLAILLALLLVFGFFAPFVTAVSLKISMD